jgi:hypothetical protein
MEHITISYQEPIFLIHPEQWVRFLIDKNKADDIDAGTAPEYLHNLGVHEGWQDEDDKHLRQHYIDNSVAHAAIMPGDSIITDIILKKDFIVCVVEKLKSTSGYLR